MKEQKCNKNMNYIQKDTEKEKDIKNIDISQGNNFADITKLCWEETISKDIMKICLSIFFILLML